MEMHRCEICGVLQMCEKHHVFGGTARQISDKWGATVWLCRPCHNSYHHHPASYQWLREKTQTKVMFEQGWSLEDWMDHFHKNYL
jgi:hypothetical protein